MAYSIQDWIRTTGSVDRIKDQSSYEGLEQEIAGDFAEAIQRGTLEIQTVLEDIGEYVSNSDDAIEISRALALLPAIFRRTTNISRHDLHLLIEYFVARLENKENNPTYDAGLGEIIAIFKIFTRLETFILGDASIIIKGIYALADNRTTFKSLPESARHDAYSILDHLFRDHALKIIKDLGRDQLIDGLLQLVVFEKKASCLVIVFPLISHISQNWNLTNSNLEKLFTSFIRYFPIKVGGTQGDASRISQEMSLYLSDCLVSNDFYASLAFPHLIEKIDTLSSLSAANMQEIFGATNVCVYKYSVQTITLWSLKLWDALKHQIWNGSNENYIKESINIVQSIAISLNRNEAGLSQDTSPLSQYISQLVKECRESIVDSPQKFLSSTGRLLNSIASSSHHAFYMVTKMILPTLLILWQKMKLESEKKLLLYVINHMLDAALEIIDKKDRLCEEVTLVVKSLASFQEVLFETFSNAIVELKRATTEVTWVKKEITKDPSCFVPALEGLTLLFKIPSYLTGVEKGMMVQELIQITMNFPRESIIHREGLLALQKISASQPTVFTDMIIPTLLDNLPESVTPDVAIHAEEIHTIAFLLDDMVNISCVPCCRELDSGFPEGAISNYWHRNFDCFMEHILKKLHSVFLSRGQVSYATAIVASILKGLNKFDGALEEIHFSAIAPQPKVLPYEFLWRKIFDEFLASSHCPEDLSLPVAGEKLIKVKKLPHESDKYDEGLLDMVGNIMLLIARSKLNTSENNITFKFYGTLMDLEIGEDPIYFRAYYSRPLIHKSMPPECQMAGLVSVYPLIGIRPDPDDDSLLTKTKSRLGLEANAGDLAINTIYNILNMESLSSRTRIAMLNYIQILIAKFHCSRDRLQSGEQIIDVINSLVKSSGKESQKYVHRLFQIIVYLASASFFCYDRNMMKPLLTLLIEGLNPEIYSPTTSSLVAQSFRMLLDDSHILNKLNYIQPRSLRKGFLLELTAPLLDQLRLYSQLKSQDQLQSQNVIDNYLIAIIGVFGRIEHSLILENVEMKKLVALALDGTNVSNDDWAKAEYIKLVRALIRDRPDDMQTYVDSIIERMVERTHNTLERPSDANVECRVLALEVLRLLIDKFGLSLQVPARVRLMSELVVAKDDCHIDVRHAAAQCLLAWLYVKP